MTDQGRIITLAAKAVIAVLVYFFYVKPKRDKLISAFTRDSRLGMPFEPFWWSFPGEERRREPLWVLIVWTLFWSVLAGLGAFYIDDVVMAGLVVLLGAAIVYFGIWWRKRGIAVSLPGIVELRFESDKIVRVMKSGERHEYIIGPKLAIYVGIAEERGIADAPDALHLFADLVEPTEELRVPIGFVGVGEWLARARHAGATVGFVTGTPTWLIQQLEALPSWKPGYFDRPAPAVLQLEEFCCQSCGGSARYEPGQASYACQFCGSAKLVRTTNP
jgi:hypothetical protein